MIISCERCSTMYELDEALLALEGSSVQCTRCQHVFIARPPGAPGRTLVGVPAAAEPPPPPRRAAAPPAPPPAPPREQPEQRAAPTAPPPPPARVPVPARGAPAPVYRPTPGPMPAQGAVRAAPVIRKDAVGTYESRLRWNARLKWLVPAAAVLLLAAAAAAWLLLGRRSDPSVERAIAEAAPLLLRDDPASLDAAIARLDPGTPPDRALAAERGLAKVLRATAGEGVEGARAAALPELRALAEAGRRDRRAARPLALHLALAGDRPAAADALRKAGGAARAPGGDPWLALADAWLDAGAPDRATRERASAKLAALVEARPDLLRARLLLARSQVELGRPVQARTTLRGILAANPAHEGARRLQERLAASPEAGEQPAPATPVAAGGGVAPAPAGGAPQVPGETPQGTGTVEGAPPEAPPAAPRRRVGVLAPAAIPEPSRASALPQVEPPEAVRQAATPGEHPAPAPVPEAEPTSPNGG